jgi:hypothetical protein
LSTVGFFVCPLSLVGAIVSAVAIRREPKGLAIAGLIIGLLGTGLYAVVILVYGAAIAACIGLGVAMQPQLETYEALRRAREQITGSQLESGEIPAAEAGQEMISEYKDGWQNPLRYTPQDGDFEIRSSGPDGQFDTEDDITDADAPEFDMHEFELEPQVDGEMIEEETSPGESPAEPRVEGDSPANEAAANDAPTDSPAVE